jgi:CBS domain containing-hemolysin-like protein
MLIAIGIGLILVLTVATGYFVAQEFAYVAVDRTALRNRAEKGDSAAKRALEVTSRLSFVLSGAQLGITVTAILVGYLAEPYLGTGLENAFETTGISESISNVLGTIFSILVATVVQMVLGELAPKNWAIAQAERLACALSRSTLIYLAVAGPVIHVFDSAANKLLRSVRIEPAEELSGAATPRDLQHIIAESGDKGLLDVETSRLLQRGLDFHDLTVRSAMIPRIDVVGVGIDEPTTKIVELLDTGHTRFPVMGNGIDDLLGVVSVADLVKIEPVARHTTTLAAVLTPAFILPETISLNSALEQMRAQHHQFACVTDEHGSFSGVITLEDIAEELVGEIQDEDDDPEPTAVLQKDGSWTLPARWRIDQLEEATGIALPESDDYETLSGIILDRLGRLPEIGDVLRIAEVPRSALTDDAPRTAIVTVLSMEHGVAGTINIVSKELTDQEGTQQ